MGYKRVDWYCRHRSSPADIRSLFNVPPKRGERVSVITVLDKRIGDTFPVSMNGFFKDKSLQATFTACRYTEGSLPSFSQLTLTTFTGWIGERDIPTALTVSSHCSQCMIIINEPYIHEVWFMYGPFCGTNVEDLSGLNRNDRCGYRIDTGQILQDQDSG